MNLSIVFASENPVAIFFTLVLIMALVGYVVNKLDLLSNEGLIDIKAKQDQWLKEDTLSAKFSFLFLFFLQVYNLFAWAVFGLKALLEFMLTILRFLWKSILWFWNEFINVIIINSLKLIWHYVFRVGLQLFKFSFELKTSHWM